MLRKQLKSSEVINYAKARNGTTATLIRQLGCNSPATLLYSQGLTTQHFRFLHNNEIEDPYAILGIDRSATPKEIKWAYHKVAMKEHPDVNGNTTESTEKFKKITGAFKELTRPYKEVDTTYAAKNKNTELNNSVAKLINSVIQHGECKILSLNDNIHLIDLDLSNYSPSHLHRLHIEEICEELTKAGLAVKYTGQDDRRIRLTGSLTQIEKSLINYIRERDEVKKADWYNRANSSQATEEQKVLENKIKERLTTILTKLSSKTIDGSVHFSCWDWDYNDKSELHKRDCIEFHIFCGRVTIPHVERMQIMKDLCLVLRTIGLDIGNVSQHEYIRIYTKNSLQDMSNKLDEYLNHHSFRIK